MAYKNDNYDPEQYGQAYKPNPAQNPYAVQAPTAGAAPGPAPAPSPAPAPAPAPAAAPQGQYDRQKFQQAWMGSGGKTVQDLQNFVAAHQGDYGAGVQILPGGKGDKILLPDGTVIDAVLAAGLGGQGAAWTGIPSQMGGSGGGGPVTLGMGGAGGVGGVNGGAGAGVDSALRDALLKLMAKSGQPVDPNDPAYLAQSQAYENARNRGAAKERAATAERAAFTGLNAGGQGSGGFDTSLNSIQENAGRDIAGNNASLMGQQVQAKRQDLMDSLQLANAIGARDQAAQIQMQLAQLDNTYKYAALGQQNNQFYSQLGQQQNQFNDTYGLNKAMFEDQANRNAILSLLGG